MLTLLLTAVAFASEGGEVDFTLAGIWASSGFVARSVIVMLGLMLLATLIITVERLVLFRRARLQSMKLAVAVGKPLGEGDLRKAVELAKDSAYDLAYLAPLLKAGLTELQQRFDAKGLTNAQRALDKARTRQLARMRRGFTILATVASTAPFVGLFGTTFGVINAFALMSSEGTGLSNISAGISEALVTTGVGIGVAVAGVWAFNYFTQRLERVAEELDSSVIDFVDWADKQLQGRADTTDRDELQAAIAAEAEEPELQGA